MAVIKKILSYSLFAGVIATSLGAARAQSIPVDGYAAIVNKRVITISDVLGALQPVEAQLRNAYYGQELVDRMEQAYHSILDSLIERALILEEFDRGEGQIPDALVDDHIQDLVAERFDNNRAAFIQALAEEGITLDEFRREMRERLVIMLLRREAVLSHLAVSPGEVRAAYRARLDEFRRPEEIHLRMLVVNKGKTEAEDRAKRREVEALREKLKDGYDFAELARSASEGSRAAQGGNWGWIKPDILRAELAEAAAVLEPGEISDVLDAGEAYYILRLEDRREETTIPFEDVQEELHRELRMAEEERLYGAWMDRLKQKYFVQRFRPPHEEQRL